MMAAYVYKKRHYGEGDTSSEFLRLSRTVSRDVNKDLVDEGGMRDDYAKLCECKGMWSF